MTVMESTREGEVRFGAEDQARINEIRELLQRKEQVQWQIGDLVLAVCGPAGTAEGMGRLRALAAELNVSEQRLSRYRITSQVFPPEKRVYDLPHSAYQFTQAYASVADEILRRVVKNPRDYTATLLSETKDQVLQEAGKMNRQPAKLTPAELFTNKIITFAERIRTHQINPGRSEAQKVLEAWEIAEPYIRAAARGRTPVRDSEI